MQRKNKQDKQMRFCYMGNYITGDGCIEKYLRRVCETKKTFQNMKNILSDSHLSFKNDKELLKLTYGQCCTD